MIIKTSIKEILFKILIIISMFFFLYVNNFVGHMMLIFVAGVWIIDRIIKKRYCLYELVLLVVISLLVGTNYLLYLGIIFNVLFIFRNLRNGLKLKPDVEVVGFGIMVLTGTISSMINAVDTKSAYTYIQIYLLLLVFLYTSKVVCGKVEINEKELMDLLTFFALLLGIGFFMTHSLESLWELSHAEIFYNLKDGIGSNTLAGIIAPFFVAVIIIINESKGKLIKIMSIVACVMLGIILLAIQSRGAYLGLIVATIWIFMRGKSKKTNFFLICVLVIGSIFLINNPEILVRFFGRFRTVVYRTGNQLNGRERLYAIAWKMFKNHPLIGHGFWQFFIYGIIGKDPHSFPLAYLASTGVIGMGGFLIYLIGIFKRLNKFKIVASKIFIEISFAAFWIMVMHGLVEPALSTHAPLSIFILLTSLPISVKRNIKKEVNDENLVLFSST